MKWEFSSMLAVSLVLITTAISSDISNTIETITSDQLALNVLFGLGFLIPGVIGGLLNESNLKEPILMIVSSFLLIGLTTILTLTISCNRDNAIACLWFFLTLQGIPTAMFETSLGFFIGFKIRERLVKIEDTD